MLRPISLFHYCDAIQARGADPARLIDRTAIDFNLLRQPSYLISEGDYRRFLDNLIAVTGDNGFVLDIGRDLKAAHYGILAYAGLASASVRDGMDRVWGRYAHAYGVMTRLSVVAEAGCLATIRISAPRFKESIYRFCVEEALSVLTNLGGSGSGQAPTFKALRFAFPRPSYGGRYGELFGCHVQFNAPHTEVVLLRDWLYKKLNTEDAELWQICCQRLEQQLAQYHKVGPTRRKLYYFLLGCLEDNPSIDISARYFNVSARTLARLLQDEGTSYRAVVQELRLEIVQEWLRSGDMTVKEISFRAGFGDVGAFRRAFKSWTGRTVTEFCLDPVPPLVVDEYRMPT